MMAHLSSDIRREPGQALVISISAVAILFVLSLALLNIAGSSLLAGKRQQQKLSQINAADAGVQDARDRLARGTIVPDDTNANWSTTFSSSGFSNSVTVGLFKDSAGNVAPGRYLVSSSGNAGGGTSSARAVVRKATLLGPFNHAMFGNTQVKLNNGDIDAYNSSTSLVTPLVTGTGSLDGVVATNGTASNAIAIGKSGAVYGSLVVGPGVSPASSAVTNISTLTPSVPATSSPSAIGYSPLTIPSNLLSGANLTTTTTLSGGTYLYETVDLAGADTVTCTGPVVLYCRTRLTIRGNGFVTSGNKPPNLLIYYTGTTDVTVRPILSFYGAIWAPNADVMLNDLSAATVTMYGCVAGKSVTCQSNNVHLFYDKALLHPGADWADHTVFRLISWEIR